MDMEIDELPCKRQRKVTKYFKPQLITPIKKNKIKKFKKKTETEIIDCSKHKKFICNSVLKERVFINQYYPQGNIPVFPCISCNLNVIMYGRFTCDHILPVSHGGKNELDNLQVLCSKCNTSKGDKLFSHIDYSNLSINSTNKRVSIGTELKEKVFCKQYFDGNKILYPCYKCSEQKINPFNYKVYRKQLLANGGTNDVSNLEIICEKCHKNKRNKIVFVNVNDQHTENILQLEHLLI